MIQLGREAHRANVDTNSMKLILGWRCKPHEHEFGVYLTHYAMGARVPA